MDTSKFFAIKRQEQQRQNPSPIYQTNLPWWQDPDYSGNKETNDARQDTIENHDFSRATHTKSNSGNCPNCNSSSFMKPSASTASRCFDCGYISGRQVNDLDTLDIMSSQDAKTLHVKQTADGGAQKYWARISRDANEIRMANAELEQSLIGKAYVDS